MPTATITKSVATAGASYRAATDTITDDLRTSVGPSSIAAAKTGSLTTRTDDNTGTLTMSASHGITTGARIDIYWSGGCRRGVTVGTVSVNSVPIDLGAGDALPAAATAVTAMVPNSEAVLITGGNVSFASFATRSAKRATVVFTEADDTEVAYAVLDAVSGGDMWAWSEEDGTTTPFASETITKVYMSHENSAAAETSLTAHVLHS